MPHTDDDTVVALYIFNLITTNMVALQLNDVLYGNHNNIPSASAAVVTSGGKLRSVVGVQAPGGRSENQLVVQIALHWSKVGDEATERQAADDRATALEQLLHEDTTMGGLVIHGFVEDVNRGESQMANNSMFRSVVMTWRGKTRTAITPTP